MFIKFKYTSDGAQSGDFTLNNPSGVATSGSHYYQDETYLENNGIVGFDVLVIPDTTTSWKFKVKNINSTYVSPAGNLTNTVPFTVGSGDYIQGSFRFKVAGWQSTGKMSSDFGGREIVLNAVGNTSTQNLTNTTATKLTNWTENKDTVSAFASGRYAIKETGYYTASFGWRSGNDADDDLIRGIAMIYKNGSEWLSRQTSYNATPTIRSVNPGLTVTCVYLEKDDYLEPYAYQQNSDADTLTADGDANNQYFQVYKCSSSQTMLENELVAARYTTNAGQSISSGSITIVNFEDLTNGYDTHGSVTTGASWKFSNQIPGKHKVSSHITYQAGSFTAGNLLWVGLYKNGAFYEILDLVQVDVTATTEYHLTGSTSIDLVSGDYIDVRVSQNTGGARLLYAADNGHTSINIEKVKTE